MAPQAFDRSVLLPYLPRLLVHWLADDPESTWRELDGTVVFVDISGFTKLSEKLAKSGRMGAEELAEAIGSCFARLLAVAYGNGGGLLKFGGDALLLLFTGTDHALKGARAAAGMRRELREIGRLETSGGKVQLRMSVGLHSGVFHLFLVGGSHREFMITGPGATQTAAMEGTAEAGEILVSPSTAALLPPRAIGNPKGPGFLLRGDPGGLTTEPAQPDIPVSGELIERCVSGAMREHLLFGTGEPEHRRVVVGFLHFDGTDALIERDGSAAFADALDELVRAVQGAVDDQGVCFLGTDVDKDGGKIILTAGAPISTENDEERMLIAARTIIEGDRRIPVRIGVNRGHVFAGDIGPAYRRTYTVMGDAVNLAARVMAKAQPGQVLVTTEVLERSKVTFGTVALEPFMVKGKAKPVQAFELGEVEGVGRDLPAVVEDAQSPLVGRDRELAILADHLERARTGSGAIVEIVGEAGIGKSRLLEEVRSRASGFASFATASDVYQTSTPYFAFRRPLRQLVGVSGDEPETTQAEALGSAVAERIPELRPMLPLLAVPLGLDLPDTEETARLTDERFRKQRMEEAIARFLSVLLPTPTLLTIEDVHWMDEASTELLHRLGRNIGTGPWLVVVTRRDLPTGFIGEEADSLTRIVPEPLDVRATEAMLREATEEAPLAPHEMTILTQRAGGNPLFLKELIAAAKAVGNIEDLPESIDEVITAQIDRLRPRDRTLLRYASVIGAEFPDRIAYAVLSTEVPDIGPQSWRYLGDFLTRDEAGTVRFTHALVRDAAYEGLSFRRRRTLHRAVGSIIESEAEDPDDVAEVLSMHYFHSSDAQRAWRFSLVAAERARSMYANVDAAEFYRRALDASKRLQIPDVDLARVNEALGDVHERVGKYAEATADYTAARRLIPQDPVLEAELLLKEAEIRERLGKYSQALRWYRRGLTAIEREPLTDGRSDELLRMRARLSVGYATIRQGQTHNREAIEWCEQAIRMAERCGARDVVAHAAHTLDWIHTAMGRPQDSPYPGLALAIYEELQDLPGLGREYSNLGVFAYYEGRWDDAVEFYTKGMRARERIGDTVHAAIGTYNIAEIQSDQGRLDEAEEGMRQALRIFRAADHREFVSYATMGLGRVASRAGRWSDADEHFARAVELFRDIGEERPSVEAEAWRAESLLFRGDTAAALALVMQCLKATSGGGFTTVQTFLHRLRGIALMRFGDLEAAQLALDESLAIGEEGKADFEVGLTLRALAELAGLRGDVTAASERAARSAEILQRLGVVRTPEIPAPSD